MRYINMIYSLDENSQRTGKIALFRTKKRSFVEILPVNRVSIGEQARSYAFWLGIEAENIK